MKVRSLILVFITLPLLAMSAKQEVSVIPVRYQGQPAIDGLVSKGEYIQTFTDVKTGITVHWQADSVNLYCALQSPGKGWLAIGFGSGGMKGSVMIIAYVDKQGQWAAEEHLGQAFFKHQKTEKPKLISAKAGMVEGKTVLEFCLPLSLSNGKTINSSSPMPFIIAMHEDNPRLSKHSNKTRGQLILTLPK